MRYEEEKGRNETPGNEKWEEAVNRWGKLENKKARWKIVKQMREMKKKTGVQNENKYKAWGDKESEGAKQCCTPLWWCYMMTTSGSLCLDDETMPFPSASWWLRQYNVISKYF